jgi:hypothetical protein
LPVPVPDADLKARIEVLVDNILLMNRKLSTLNDPDIKIEFEYRIKEVDTEIDNLVYHAYGLIGQDVALINNGISAGTSVQNLEKELGLKKGSLKNPDGTPVDASRSLGSLYNAYHKFFEDSSEESE